MDKKRVRKTLTVLLTIFFLVSLTAGAVSATCTLCKANDMSIAAKSVDKISSTDTNNLLDYLINILQELYKIIFGISGSSDNGGIKEFSHPVLKILPSTTMQANGQRWGPENK